MTPAQAYDLIGDTLYTRVRAIYDPAVCKQAGIYSELLTIGKITGMILDAFSPQEVVDLLHRDEYHVGLTVVDCILAFFEDKGLVAGECH